MSNHLNCFGLNSYTYIAMCVCIVFFTTIIKTTKNNTPSRLISLQYVSIFIFLFSSKLDFSLRQEKKKIKNSLNAKQTATNKKKTSKIKKNAIHTAGATEFDRRFIQLLTTKKEKKIPLSLSSFFFSIWLFY